MIDIDEFKETIGVRELPDENRVGYQTLAGFILSRTGSIPSTGDSFDWNGFHFEIVDMDGLRIDRVFVSRIEPEEESGQDIRSKEQGAGDQGLEASGQESVASGQEVTDNVQNSEPSGSDNEQEKFNQ